MKRIRTTAIAGILMAAALSGPAAPAAAAGCNGEGCTGKNPSTMGCAGSTIYGTETSSGYDIEFRASPMASCGAVWARHQAIGEGDFMGYAVTISIERRHWRATRSTAFYTASIGARKSGYTLMFGRNPDYYHRACIREMSDSACTPWYNGALQAVSLP